MSINSVAISGNLTRDSELRALANGTSVLTFCVAVNERVRQEDGSWADRPNRRVRALQVHRPRPVLHGPARVIGTRAGLRR